MPLFKKARSPFWWYDFRLRGKRYRGSTGEKTKAAATTVEDAVRTKLLEGKEAPSRFAKTPTVREFSVRFLLWAENSNTLEPSSFRFYRYGVRLLLMTPLADTPLDQLTREIVECTAFRRPVIDRRTQKPTGEIVPCSPTYTNQALRTLKALIGKAVEWKVIFARPVFSTLRAVRRHRTIDADTEIQIEAQYLAPTKHGRHNRMRHQARLVLIILQDTGARPEDVFSMRIENIDWLNGRIWIPEGKTPNSARFIGMSQRMRDGMIDWTRKLAGKARNPPTTGWLFPSKRAKSGHLESIAKGWQAARSRAGLDRSIVPYLARHTYGTYQMEATGNVFSVSRSMGHADVRSMDPYQHPDTQLLNKSINERNKATEARRLQIAASGHTFGHTAGPVQ